MIVDCLRPPRQECSYDVNISGNQPSTRCAHLAVSVVDGPSAHLDAQHPLPLVQQAHVSPLRFGHPVLALPLREPARHLAHIP